MASGKYAFVIEQGSTLRFGIEYVDVNLQPIDLTGYDARMQIRSDYADRTNVLYATVSASIDADGTGLYLHGLNQDQPLTSGSIGVVISAVKTASMSFCDNAYYDLELYSGSLVTRLLEGMVILNPEVTLR